MHVLITGATGFVGRTLCRALGDEGHRVAVATRVPLALPGVEEHRIGDLATFADWSGLLERVRPEAIVHAAALVGGARAEKRLRRVNAVATETLARQAAEGGVRRFVFLSTLKVHGERTEPGAPFVAASPLRPEDAYARSKAEAERRLLESAAGTSLEPVILRPPLVYGPGVGGNFSALVRAVAGGIPLPFAAVDNRRSLVHVDNLVDLIALCLHHHEAAGRAFLVGDGEDLSTPELLRAIGRALGRRARLFALSPRRLERMLLLVGAEGVHRRLCLSLQADIGDAAAGLGWRPPLGVHEGIGRALGEPRTSAAER